MTTTVTSISSSISRLGKLASSLQKDAVESRLQLDQLVPYRRQARKTWSEESLVELASTMTDVGVLQPLLVRPLGDNKYEIVAGERRWRAARIAMLPDVPVFIKALDDETIDKIHLYENIHRENLDNMDLAKRVQEDLNMPGATVDSVAEKYKKQKSFISKLSSIARGGEAMHELIAEGVTADREILSAVSSMERQNPTEARELVEVLKNTDATNKRAVVTQHIKAKKDGVKKRATNEGKPPKEPSWRVAIATPLPLSEHSFIGVEISPHSEYASEFADLSRKHGKAHLATKHRHAKASYALVSFGKDDKNLRAYKADELRLTCVDESQ